MVWYGMVWYGMVWYGMVWQGMVGCSVVWYGMVYQYGMELAFLMQQGCSEAWKCQSMLADFPACIVQPAMHDQQTDAAVVSYKHGF